MAKDQGVNIPITVTGAQKATEDLKSVAGAASAAGSATAQSSAAAAASNFNQAAQGVKQFAAATGALETGLLSAGGAAAKLFTSFGPMTAIMLGVSLLETVFASLSASIDDARQKTEDLLKAQKELRDQGVTDRFDIGKAAAAAGVGAQQHDAIAADIGRMQSDQRITPVPGDLALSAALARQVMAGSGQPFNEDDFLAGLQMMGRKPLDLAQGKGGRDELIARIRGVQEAGASDAARAEAQAQFLSERENTIRNSIRPDAVRGGRETQRDSAMERLIAERPEFDEEARNYIRGLLADNARLEERLIAAEVFERSPGWHPFGEGRFAEARAAGDIAASLRDTPLPVTGAAPSTYNVYYNTQNVGSQQILSSSPLSQRPRDLFLDGGRD